MKKKNIRTIISLIAAAAIVCSLSVCAFATVKTIAVTVKAGQNLEGICRENGLDLGKNKKLIMELNGFTNPSQMNRILAGSTIILPAPSSEEARSSGPVPIVAGDASKAMPGDKVAFYVVLYTIRPGDILANLYAQWGSELGTYQCQMISALNGLSNLNQLVVDKMLYLPVNRGDIAGMANYTVLEHTVAYGETMFGICGNYGLDYGTARASLQCFNPGVDFNSINVNTKIYIPVTGSLPTAGAMSAASVLPAAASAAVSADGPVQAITSNGVVEAAPAAPGMAQALGVLRGDPALLSTAEVYDGFGVVMECNGTLVLRLEKVDMDVNVAFTQQTMQGYSPRPGDYVKLVFTPTDFLLASIMYVSNVFIK